MGALFGISHHPVEIKKISLRTWSLRDEIIYKLQHQIDPNQETSELVKKLHLEYESTTRPPKAIIEAPPEGLTLIEGGNEGEEQKTEEAKAEGEDPKEEVSPEKNEAEASNDSEVIIFRPPPEADFLSKGVCFLNDLRVLDICFFSETPYLFGQTIVIDFLIPGEFLVTAEVLSCFNYNMRTRIISDNRPKYRIHAKMMCYRPGERTLLRNFIQSIQPTIQAPKPKKAKKENSDLDDLSDLGL